MTTTHTYIDKTKHSFSRTDKICFSFVGLLMLALVATGVFFRHESNLEQKKQNHDIKMLVDGARANLANPLVWYSTSLFPGELGTVMDFSVTGPDGRQYYLLARKGIGFILEPPLSVDFMVLACPMLGGVGKDNCLVYIPGTDRARVPR